MLGLERWECRHTQTNKPEPQGVQGNRVGLSARLPSRVPGLPDTAPESPVLGWVTHPHLCPRAARAGRTGVTSCPSLRPAPPLLEAGKPLRLSYPPLCPQVRFLTSEGLAVTSAGPLSPAPTPQ